MTTEEGFKEVKAILEARDSHCPVCKDRHQYCRQLSWHGEMDWPSDRLDVCPSFENLTPQQRAKVIEENKGGKVCLSWRHERSRCNLKEPLQPGGRSIQCQVKTAGLEYGRLHHKLKHLLPGCIRAGSHV